MFPLCMLSASLWATSVLPIHADPVPAPAAPAAEVNFEAQFRDESNLKLFINDTSIPMTTKYGTLNIPIGDVRKIRMGFRYPAGAKAKIEEACKNLGAPAFIDRETAEKALLGFKEAAIPLLKKTANSSDPETAGRAESILGNLSKSLPEEAFDIRDGDSVETAEFTIVGNITITEMKVRSKHFGDSMLQIADVREIRGLVASSSKGVISVDASKYAKTDWSAWSDTKIVVNKGGKFSIQATGQIDQWPMEPGRYMTGPAGTSAPVNNLPPAIANNPNGMAYRQFRSGMLIGKIGENGTPFVVGTSYSTGTARSTQAGKLYLAIAPSSWGNNDCSGSYKVTIKIDE
ncbi:MAG: hypothetical protein ACRC8S_14660 [Fimbriiglobus sp.]